MSHSISTADPEPSAPSRGHTVGATTGQWPERKPIWPDRRVIDLIGIEHPLVLAPVSERSSSRPRSVPAAAWARSVALGYLPNASCRQSTSCER